MTLLIGKYCIVREPDNKIMLENYLNAVLLLIKSLYFHAVLLNGLFYT
jgi:hypothetical protein